MQLIALKSVPFDRYVSADIGKNGQLFADRTVIGDWEKFYLLRLGNGFALRTWISTPEHPVFVCADYSMGGLLVANRSAVREWETFEIQSFATPPIDPGPVETRGISIIYLKNPSTGNWACVEGLENQVFCHQRDMSPAGRFSLIELDM